MKVLPFRVPKPLEQVLLYQVDEGVKFYDQLHQHVEIQISLVMEGEGDLVAGDSISRFEAGDIVVFGSQLPHLFRSEAHCTPVKMHSLFFTPESFGQVFSAQNGDSELENLLRRIEGGLRLLERKSHVAALILKLEDCSHLQRMIGFMELLQLLSDSPSERLSSFSYARAYTEEEGTRMGRVYNYAIDHFREEITLPEIADVASMTPNAFCRYFKLRTNKTFFQFVTELRIEHACRLLQRNDDASIAEVSEHSGFRNLSNFNRQFRYVKGCTPTQFRKMRLLNP